VHAFKTIQNVLHHVAHKVNAHQMPLPNGLVAAESSFKQRSRCSGAKPVSTPEISDPCRADPSAAMQFNSMWKDRSESSSSRIPGSRLEHLYASVACLHKDYIGLKARLVELQEENIALHEVLAESGVLSMTKLEIRTHKRRFSRARRQHPCAWPGSLPQAVGIPGPAFQVSRFLGLPTKRALRAVCRVLETTIGEVEKKMRPTGRLYVCGGTDGQERLSSAERFNLSNGTWEVLPPMIHRRYGITASVLHGRLYVCGGFNGQEALSSAERFDPGSGTWELLLPMTEKRFGAASGVINGQLYVCGGSNGQERLCSLERFDPCWGAWEHLTSMTFRRFGTAAAPMDGFLYVCGGSDGRHDLNSAERFDPDMEVWLAVPSMEQQRSFAAAATVNGRLYVCGGIKDKLELSSVECYIPEQQQWVHSQPMMERRGKASCGTIGGCLYICGGSNGQEQLSSAERFDPTTRCWEPLKGMTQRRCGASAAVLLPTATPSPRSRPVCGVSTSRRQRQQMAWTTPHQVIA